MLSEHNISIKNYNRLLFRLRKSDIIAYVNKSGQKLIKAMVKAAIDKAE